MTNPLSLSQTPEQIAFQHLTHYFQSPTIKTMPFLHNFTIDPNSCIYALKYLFTFIRTTVHSQQVHNIFIDLMQQEHIVDKIITNSEINDRKMLLGRYVGLVSAMGEAIFKSKKEKGVNVGEMERKAVREIVKDVQRLNQQEKVYILNKILMIGKCDVLFECQLQKNKPFQSLIDVYGLLVKKQTIISFAVQNILKASQNNLKEILNNFISFLINYHIKTKDFQHFNKLLSTPIFLPSNCKQFVQIFSEAPQILQQFVQQLLVWWVEGNDHYLPYGTIKTRANILALILMKFDQNKVLIVSGAVSIGIQKRLAIGGRKNNQVVNLIWNVLIRKVQFQVTKDKIKGDIVLLEDDVIEQTKDQQEDDKKVTQQLYVQKQDSDSDKEQKSTDELLSEQQFALKPPRNIYDCLMGLRNPVRKPLIYKTLPKMIRNNSEDLIFTWPDLIKELLYDMNEKSNPSTLALFVMRPDSFIESVGSVFFNKDHSLNDKIELMKVLSDGVEELSSRPIKVEEEAQNNQFYFKKVSSKYLNDQAKPSLIKELDPSKTRRWGQTRIDYENRIKQKQSGSVSLKIVDNSPYINRLYEISNQLFFHLISKLVALPIFPNQPMFMVPLLKLLATLAENLKNHIQKYKILTQITEICLEVIKHIENLNKKQSNPTKKAATSKKWKDTSLSVLHVLNKVSLVIDKYIPNRMLNTLQQCINTLQKTPEYGIGPILQMIAANIYTNVSTFNKKQSLFLQNK